MLFLRLSLIHIYQPAKRASWARVLLVPTLLLGSASMAAFPVHAAQVELNQTCLLYTSFRPEFITFRADTLRKPGMVSLQVVPKAGVPADAKKPYPAVENPVEVLMKSAPDSVTTRHISFFSSSVRRQVSIITFRHLPPQAALICLISSRTWS